MSQEILPSRIDHLLFRLRKPLAAIAFLFTLYAIGYLWLFIPYEDFTYRWYRDSRLMVLDVPAESLALGLLKPGDTVLEIGGKPIRRMRPIYPLPIQQAYEYKVQRDDQILVITVPFSSQVTPLAIRLRLPAAVLALAGWFVGAVMLLLAKINNTSALRAGYIFIFGSAVIIGVQTSLNGVPGTWLFGYALLFLLVPAWIYMGLIPRITPLPLYGRRAFKLLVAIAGLLALLATFEVLYLYSQPTSFQELTGLSMYLLSFLLSGLALLASLVILTRRCLALPQSSYLRQQLLILLTFFALGTLPAALLTFIPTALLGMALLPFEFAIILMLLIPAGYLFVIYRRGFLGLDLFFSRSLYLILLSLVIFGFYTATFYLVQRLLDQENSAAIVSASVVFLPTFLLAIYANKPVHNFVDRLIYGDVVDSQAVLTDYTQALSSRPEHTTLNRIVDSLAKTMNSARATLILRDESGYLSPVSVIGVDQDLLRIPPEWLSIDRPLVRSAVDGEEGIGQLFNAFVWAEILVPVRVRTEQIGLLAISRPGPDGYFNSKQVSFLTLAAGVLAVGAENILLFATARRQARRIMFVQEEERRSLSRQLHDDPLQGVTYAINVIDQLLMTHKLRGDSQGSFPKDEITDRLLVVVEHLRQVAMSLRDVCIGLYPPFHDQGVELVVREAVRQFAEKYRLNIDLTIEVSDADVSEDVTVVIGRILTEALNNIVKHAPTAAVWVALRYGEDKRMELAITDNGPGSPVLEMPYSELIRRGHLGIIGMHEWAQQVNADLDISSNSPQGTSVILRCPLSVTSIP